jgi:hypothetical protein
MLRKLVFVAALALGIGGGFVATENAQAAVAQPATTSTLAHEASSSSLATQAYYVRHVYHRGYYHGGYRHGGYYRGGYYHGGVYRGTHYYHGQYGGCRVVRTRVRVGDTWVWRTRRVCY